MILENRKSETHFEQRILGDNTSRLRLADMIDQFWLARRAKNTKLTFVFLFLKVAFVIGQVTLHAKAQFWLVNTVEYFLTEYTLLKNFSIATCKRKVYKNVIVKNIQ